MIQELRREALLEQSKGIEQRKVIFVVDDEAMLLRALARVLRDPDYHIFYFESPVEALTRIDELKPVLIVSDNSMPGMTGFDFLRKVRADRPTIRTLMLTGGYIGAEIRASVAAGEIDRLIEKPWDGDLLRKTLRELSAR